VIHFGRLTPLAGSFTSEAVAAGHPDKICDQISDAVLDAALTADEHSRVAVECAIKGHEVWLFGELTTTSDAPLDYQAIVRSVLCRIGHQEGTWGLDPEKVEVRTSIAQQSLEIAAGVKGAGRLGAGLWGKLLPSSGAQVESPTLGFTERMAAVLQRVDDAKRTVRLT